MESREKSFISVKVNQLKKSDQELAYANHIINFKKIKQKPDKFEDFLNEKVFSKFIFKEAKEGYTYWFITLDEILIKENKKNLYKKELSLLKTKQITLFLIMCFLCFVFFILLFVYLVSILIKL